MSILLALMLVWGSHSQTSSVHDIVGQLRVQLVLDTQYSDYTKPKDLAHHIWRASKSNNIDPLLLTSLVEAESGFNPNAVSRAGAVGITQVVPRHWGTSHAELLDYRKALHKGAEIIRMYSDLCKGDMKCAVHSYNVGITAYRRGARNKAFYTKIMRNRNASVNLLRQTSRSSMPAATRH